MLRNTQRVSMKSSSMSVDKPWIVKKKKSSIKVMEQIKSAQMIQKLRDQRLASIDSSAKLAELIEGDYDLEQS